MIEEKKITTTVQWTRRAFLQHISMGILLPTVIGMVPDPIKGNVYAQTEKKLSDEWLKLASKYGSHTGKFGKIGDPVTLTVGYQPYCTPYWTSSLNKQAHIFNKYLPKGSKVVWFRALSGPLINNNMFSGKNQFGYMAETPALRAGEMVECDMVAVTGYDLGETGSICVRNDLLKEGKVKVPSDLDGKPVGTPFGSYSHRQALTWAEQNQVKLDLQNQSIQQQMAHLRDQKIWAGVLWEPYPSWLEQQEIATRWVTGQEMPCTCKTYHADATEHTFRVVGSTLAIHDWLQERPDIMGAYLKAEEECRDMLTHDPDLAAYYIWTDIPEVPPAVVRSTLEMMVWDGRITPEVKQHLTGCAQMWRKHGFLEKERSAHLDQYIAEWADDSYLRLAMEEMAAEGWWTSNNLPGFPQAVHSEQLKRHHWKTYEKTKLETKTWNPTKV